MPVYLDWLKHLTPLQLLKHGEQNALKYTTVTQFINQVCRPVLREVYSTFAFDKIPYSICKIDPAISSLSRHCVEKHTGGNCYAQALRAQKALPAELFSFCVMGNVPAYFMRPSFWGLCHAALFVPCAYPGVLGVILDPSVYCDPIVIPSNGSAPKITAPAGQPGSIITQYCESLRSEIVWHHPGTEWRVVNTVSTDDATDVAVSGGLHEVCVHLQSELHQAKSASFTYVLGFVKDFDAVVTRHVHGINTGLFRVTTDSSGRFLSTFRFENGKFQFVRHRPSRQRTEIVEASKLTRRSINYVMERLGEVYLTNLRYGSRGTAKHIYNLCITLLSKLKS